MKTKFLLSALGLTAAFAACTNEDIMEANVSNAALEGRKVVDMELVTELGSRANVAGWESTDKIGSILVDPTTMWDVEANKHHGNNRWDFDGTKFTTQGTTVEGAWMFYYPYDAAMSKERGALKAYKSIVNQEYDATGDKMYANDFAVSPVYYVNAAEGGAKVDVVLNSVYAYGNIKAALPQAAAGAKVSKVLLRYKTAFNDSLAINAETVASLAAMNYAYTTGAVTQTNPDGKTPQPLFGTVKQWWNCDSTQTSLAKTADAKNGLRNYTKGASKYVNEGFTSIASNGGETTSNYILIDCKDAPALADTMFTTRVLLPAGVVSDMIELFIYTDKGVFGDTINDVTPAANLYFKRGLKADLHNVNRVADTETEKQPTYLKMSIANADKTPIIETTDLVNLIKQHNPTTASAIDVTDQLMGSVVLNDAVAEALAANNKVTVLKVNNINIACTKAQTIEKLQAVKIDGEGGNVTVKAGSNITIGGAWSVAGTTTIETGATVTVAKNCGKGDSKTMVKGTLNINNGVKYTSTVSVDGGALVCGSAVATTATTVEDPTITTWINEVKTGSLTINVNTISNHKTTWGVNTNNATALTIAINDTLDIKTSVLDINKNTTVSFGASLLGKVNSNAGTITNNAELEVTTNVGTITNNAELVVTTNNGTINNSTAEAELTVENNGTTTTYAANAVVPVINMVANTYNTIGNNYGIINYNTEALLQVEKNMGVEADLNTRYGHVVYTVTTASTDKDMADFMAQHDDVTKLILNADFTITATALEGTGAIQIARLKYVEAGAINVTVAEGKKNMFWDCPIHFTDNAKIKGAGELYFFAGSPMYIETGKTVILDKTTLNFANGVTFPEAQIKNFGTINHNLRAAFDMQGLSSALASGKDVKLSNDIELEASDLTELQNSINSATEKVVIDGNGKTLTIPAPLTVGENVTLKNLTIIVPDGKATTLSRSTWSGKGKGAITATEGALIENCTFESPYTQYDIVVVGDVTIKDCKFLTPTADNDDLKDGSGNHLGKRAVYITKSVNVTIKDCELATEVYAFNTSIGTAGNGVLTVTGCNIDGWASWSGLKSASFTNCSFGKSGNYEACRPYDPTTWTNCTFSKDYKIGCGEDGIAYKFVNCTQNGVKVTENIVTGTDASGLSSKPETGTPIVTIE